MTAYYKGRINFQTQPIIVGLGEQTSEKILLNGFGLVGVIFPAALTSTSMTFTGSQDDITYTPLYNTDGVQLTSIIAADRILLFVPGDFVGINYLKIVLSVPEDAERTLQAISRSFI